MTRKIRMTVMFVAAILTAQANADQVLNATNTGWFRSDGDHNGYIAPLNDHYTGDMGSLEFRSFFIFDLIGQVDPVSSATFRAMNSSDYGYWSSDPTEILTLYEVTAPVANLSLHYPDPADAIDIYSGLANGAALGTVSVSAADNGQFVEIELNAVGVEAVNNAFGSAIAFGGALTTLNSPEDERVFDYSGSPLVELVLVTVPEPATVSLLAMGLLSLSCGRGPRNSKKTLNGNQ